MEQGETTTEYRVSWRREGWRRHGLKRQRFESRRALDAFLRTKLRATGRRDLLPITELVIERRQVGPWEHCPR